jgi:hypothetical protein
MIWYAVAKRCQSMPKYCICRTNLCCQYFFLVFRGSGDISIPCAHRCRCAHLSLGYRHCLTTQDACDTVGLHFEVLLGRAGGQQWPMMVGNNKQEEGAADDEAATKRVKAERAIVMAMGVAGNKEGKGNGNKGGRLQRGRGWQGNGNGNKGSG